MLQHMLHMLVNEWQLHRRMTAELLKVRGVITVFDAAQYDSGSSNVILRMRENIHSAFNESLGMSTLLSHQIAQ